VRLARGIDLLPKIDKKLGLVVLYPSVEEIAKAIAEREQTFRHETYSCLDLKNNNDPNLKL